MVIRENYVNCIAFEYPLNLCYIFDFVAMNACSCFSAEICLSKLWHSFHGLQNLFKLTRHAVFRIYHVPYESAAPTTSKFFLSPQGMYLLLESPELWPSQIWFLGSKKFKLEEKFVQMSIILLIS